MHTHTHTHTDDKIKCYSLSRKKVRHAHIGTKEVVRRLFTKRKRKTKMELLINKSTFHKTYLYQ
jgi:hypothetical protein